MRPYCYRYKIRVSEFLKSKGHEVIDVEHTILQEHIIQFLVKKLANKLLAVMQT